MATAYKRTKIKTGPHSWINKTTRQDGTSFTSVTNKSSTGGKSSRNKSTTTTNISSKGVRKTQNNAGYRLNITSHKPKSSSTSSCTKPRKKSGSLPSFSFFGSKKSTTKSKAAYKPRKISAAERKQNEADHEESQMQTVVMFANMSDLAEALAIEKAMVADDHDILILNTIPAALQQMVCDPTSYEYFDIVSEIIVELERIEENQVNDICKEAVQRLKDSFESLKEDIPDYSEYATEDKSVFLKWPFIVTVAVICFIIQLLF